MSENVDQFAIYLAKIFDLTYDSFGLYPDFADMSNAEQLPYYLFLADGGNVLNISHAVNAGMYQCR